MLSDSSILLYPPLPSPLPLLDAPSCYFAPPTAIPPISTSACFFRLLPNPAANPGHVLFLTAAPHGSSVLLRAWILLHGSSGGGNDHFSPARLNFKRDRDKLGLALDLHHGFSVEIAGSVNVFVLHGPAAGQIWILAAKLVGQAGKDGTLDLTKCAVIECTLPIYSIRVSPGFLLLGEVGGVRVFPLRPLVKGQAVKRMDSALRRISESLKQSANGELRKDGQKKRLPNGLVIDAVNRGNGAFHGSDTCPGSMSCCCSGKGDGLMEGNMNSASECCCKERADHRPDSTKLRTLKLRQNPSDFNSFFVAIKCAEAETSESITGALSSSVKAVSIHVISHRRFLILDSIGNLYLLSLHNIVLTSEATTDTFLPSKAACMRCLGYPMKVQRLAVLPDISLRSQIVWISDAFHSVHIISVANSIENDKDESEEKPMQISAIFTSEKIRDIVPLAATAVLILGQGNIFAYAIA